MSNVNALRLEKIILRPLAGSRIDDCIEEATLCSVANKCVVEFTHNDRIHTADYRKIYYLVANSPEKP